MAAAGLHPALGDQRGWAACTCCRAGPSCAAPVLARIEHLPGSPRRAARFAIGMAGWADAVARERARC
jgi:hypothetical protein